MPERHTSPDQRDGSVTRLTCALLPSFDRADLASVRCAFQSVAPCPLRQSWQSEESGQFAPGMVRIGWRGNELLVYAELTDADIHTNACAPNQRLWELGDAFEIFLRAEGREDYVELQIAPNNQRLQLRYANRAAVDRARRTNSLEQALIPGEAFRSKVWIDAQPSRWHVLAEIPASVVCGTDAVLPGSPWRFSFSRYDHTQGLPDPVISSSSPHAVADFHRQEEWGVIQFVADGRTVVGCGHDAHNGSPQDP